MLIAHDKHMRNVANPFPPALCARQSSRNTRLTQRSMGDNVDTNAPCTDMVGSSTCAASGLNVAGWVCPLCAGRLAWLTTNFAALFKSCRGSRLGRSALANLKSYGTMMDSDYAAT